MVASNEFMKKLWYTLFSVVRHQASGMACMVATILVCHYLRRGALDTSDITDAILAFFMLLIAYVGIALLRSQK
jgi:hypothetical protein